MAGVRKQTQRTECVVELARLEPASPSANRYVHQPVEIEPGLQALSLEFGNSPRLSRRPLACLTLKVCSLGNRRRPKIGKKCPQSRHSRAYRRDRSRARTAWLGWEDSNSEMSLLFSPFETTREIRIISSISAPENLHHGVARFRRGNSRPLKLMLLEIGILRHVLVRTRAVRTATRRTSARLALGLCLISARIGNSARDAKHRELC